MNRNIKAVYTDEEYYGKTEISGDNVEVSINMRIIDKGFKSGKIFYGIKPKDLGHAIELVVEHETCHVMKHFEEVYFDIDLLTIANTAFGHTSLEVTDD